jgi:hypothetical protein
MVLHTLQAIACISGVGRPSEPVHLSGLTASLQPPR